MPQARDEAGNIWEVDANGNPVRLIQQAGSAPAPAKGTIYTPPQDPTKQADEARKQAAEQRAQEDQALQRRKFELDQQQAERSARKDSAGTVDEKKVATLTTRIAGAFGDINSISRLDPEAQAPGVFESMRGGLQPQGFLGIPSRMIAGPNRRTVHDAQRDALDALLTLGTGAAYNQEQLDGQMVAYFPQYGDTPEEIAVKNQRMQRIIAAAKANAGPAWSVVEPQIAPFMAGLSGNPPPPAAGGVGDTSGMQRVATGDRRWVEDTETNQTLYNMFRQGRSFDEMQAYAGTRGYRLDPNPEAFAYARKNPGYNPFNSAGRYEELSTRQKLARTPLAGYAGGATNALTFGLNDELYGAANALVGEDYTQARDRFQGAKRAVADMNPVSDILGNITGGMLLPAGAAAVGSRAAPGLTNAVMGALARNPVKSAGAYGAAYGAGDQNDNRLLGAAVGGVGGMGGGAAGKYLLGPLAAKIGGSSGGQAVANALEPVAGRIRQAIGGGARVAPAQVSRAESMIGQNIGDMAPVRQNIADAAEMGLPFSLADADPRLRMLAGTVTRKSPDARALAENALEPRAMGQIDRLLGGIDENLAQRVNIEQRGKQLIEAGRTEAAPYYNMANSAPAQVDDQINAYLQTPAGRDALRRAYDIAANEGRDPVALGFAVDDAGEVVMREAPTFETLDLVKRGLDSKLNEARNPITGALDLEGNPQLGAIETLRKGFVGRMDQLNPQYPQARGAFAKWAQKRDALNAGQALAAPGRLPRDVENALPRLSQNLDEVQRGYATGMGDTAEKLRYSANPYDAVMGSPSTQQKMRMLFPEGADKMLRRYELEREMGKTRYETLGGSPTAARQAMDETFSPMLAEQAGNIVGGVTTGAPTAGTAIRMGLAGLKFGMGKRAEKKAAELAPILFDQNPAGLLSYFDDVATRLKANEAYKNKWKGRAGLFGGSLTAPLLLNATSGY